jgi:hypothetical protein
VYTDTSYTEFSKKNILALPYFPYMQDMTTDRFICQNMTEYTVFTDTFKLQHQPWRNWSVFVSDMYLTLYVMRVVARMNAKTSCK